MPDGVTLISLIDRNIASVGDSLAYRYLDYSASDEGHAVELTWTELGRRLRAVGAHVQRVATRGDRVAILAPQGLEYVVGFFAAIKAGAIAVPLFPPELRGHSERLETALLDARPTVVLTTSAAVRQVEKALAELPGLTPHLIIIDDVPDSDGDSFAQVDILIDDVSHLQYTSGATRPPAGVEITHRAVGTNLIQMILSIDLMDRKAYGVSWLPLFHDMGLSMIGFPAVYGGHSTLMSPTAFIRRPQRWIRALAAEAVYGRAITAAPNFAYEYTAQRGLPSPGEEIDLSHAVLIIGAEPVSMAAIEAFNAVFAPYGLKPTAFMPSYGVAEATLMVATIAPTALATAVYLDRERLGAGRAVAVAADDPRAVALVPCGQPARSLSAVIVDRHTATELPDGEVGEIWLHGQNIGRGYWGRPEETAATFGATLSSTLDAGSHAEGVPQEANWLRTGDLGCYLDEEILVTGRLADLIVLDGRQLYPQHIEATTEEASPMVRPGHVTAFVVPADGGDRLIVVAERASGTGRSDPAPAVEAIREAVSRRHAVTVSDVRLVPAGAIPRTTSGKLARRASGAQYLNGAFDRRKT